jgi:hypothetical protein
MQRGSLMERAQYPELYPADHCAHVWQFYLDIRERVRPPLDAERKAIFYWRASQR